MNLSQSTPPSFANTHPQNSRHLKLNAFQLNLEALRAHTHSNWIVQENWEQNLRNLFPYLFGADYSLPLLLLVLVKIVSLIRSSCPSRSFVCANGARKYSNTFISSWSTNSVHYIRVIIIWMYWSCSIDEGTVCFVLNNSPVPIFMLLFQTQNWN